ncbi:hypothetical protein C8Q76DRAFT_800975 [Earliella scabrosa]|nr:hypothetical protein C8Q76DRAFT_800975 [Earliella scabrosa]
MPLRGAFVSEPRVQLIDREQTNEETDEVETTLYLIVEGYARRVKVQRQLPVSLAAACETTPAQWNEFRASLVSSGVHEALSQTQRDAVEAVVCLFEFVHGGSQEAIAMWPTFLEKLLMIAIHPDGRDVSSYLVGLIRWSQEIIVPWTRDLAMAPMPPELVARWGRPGGRRETDDADYESDDEPLGSNRELTSNPASCPAADDGFPRDATRSNETRQRDEPRPAQRPWYDAFFDSDEEWEEED